jgi:branched-chain amino acid transport system substrate-binding protein
LGEGAGNPLPSFIYPKTLREDMFPRAVLLFLIWWLPACAALPPVYPSRPAPAAREAEADQFQRAETAYRRQAYGQALQGYTAYLARYPQGQNAVAARLKEAELLGLTGDWQGSLRRYQALLAREPSPETALKARYGIGRAYFKLGQYQAAIQVLDSLTAGDLPRSLWFSTQALLAEIALKQGQVTQAFSRLRLAAQDLPSGDQEWFDDLKTRVVEAASPEELANLAALYRDSPLSAPLLLRLARLARESGRLDEAQKWAATLKERFPNSPEAAAVDRPIAGQRQVVGVLLPLSGELSNVGVKVKRGMELAAKQTPLELAFRDTHNDPEAAAQAVRELAREQNLLVVLGPLTSGVAQTAADAAQAAGVPLIALSQKAGLTQTGDLIFQAFLTPRQQVRALLRQTLGTMGLRRYAALYPDSAYGRAFMENFKEELETQGGELAAQESYASGTRDFAPVLASLKEAWRSHAEAPAPVEALFVPDDPGIVAAVAAQLPNLSWPGVRLLGTNLLSRPETAGGEISALEGVLFPDAYFAGDANPAVQSFVNAYRWQFDEDPDYLAAQGYLTVRLMVRLLSSGAPPARADLPRQLLALPASPELPWFRGFNSAREEEAALYLLTIRNGRVEMAFTAPGPRTRP